MFNVGHLASTFKSVDFRTQGPHDGQLVKRARRDRSGPPPGISFSVWLGARCIPHSSGRNIFLRTFEKTKSAAVRAFSSLLDKPGISQCFATGSRPFLRLIAILETHGSDSNSFLARLRKDFFPEPQIQENSQRLQELDDGLLVFAF